MILFLDFDGVICTGRVAWASGEEGVISGLDSVALMFLNRICREYRVRVVISSTWRDCGQRRRRDFYELFACHGYLDLARAIHEDWRTKNLPDDCRGFEIEEWLSAHADEWDDYIILDDNPDMLEHQKARLILTDACEGMLSHHFRQIEEKLMRDRDARAA